MSAAKPQDGTRRMIVISNALNRSICRMSLVQHRIVYFAISIARKSGDGFSDKSPVRFTTNEFCAAFPNANLGGSYTQLRRIIQELSKLQTVVTWSDADGVKRTTTLNWFAMTEYKAGGKISIVFSQPIWQHISGLVAEFTRYPLYWISKLSSAYACRMVGLLSQFKSTGVLSISIANLREILGVPTDAYKSRPDHLRERVFNPVVAELRKNGWSLTWQQHEDRVRLVFSVPGPSTHSTSKLSTTDTDKHEVCGSKTGSLWGKQ